MGKLPIISRRGTRDNEFVSAACSFGCGARPGTACGCAADDTLPLGTSGGLFDHPSLSRPGSPCNSSACNTSDCDTNDCGSPTAATALASIARAASSTVVSRHRDPRLRQASEDELLRDGQLVRERVRETVESPSQRHRRLRRGEVSQSRRSSRRGGAVRRQEESSELLAGDIDQEEKRQRVAAGSERLSPKGHRCEVSDTDIVGSSVVRREEKRARGFATAASADASSVTISDSTVDSTALPTVTVPRKSAPTRGGTLVDSISLTVRDSRVVEGCRRKSDVVDRTDCRSAVAVSIRDPENPVPRSLAQEARRRHRDPPTACSYSVGIGAVPRALLLGLLVMSLVCEPILGVPADRSRLDLLEEAFEQDDLANARNTLDEAELEIIRRSILQALGLQRIPDPSKANVSQAEYERAHREYLKKVQLSHSGPEPRKRRSLHIFHATDHPGNRSSLADGEEVGRHALFFPVEIPEEDGSVDHAALRLLLEGHHRRRYGEIEVLLYLTTDDSRRLLGRHRIPIDDPRDTRWIELDMTKAASAWHDYGDQNLGIELEFLHDGLPAPRAFSSPALNVFATAHDEDFMAGRRRRAALDPLRPLHVGRRTECRGDKKCCRHEMTVIFKDLKGFDFIVQPKFFDAGYCKGRCPPRYNPAHHHALLQSLIWKEDRSKAPRPCCAPSKLTEVEIVYYDENNPDKLKVSNWKNMRVEECACS